MRLYIPEISDIIRLTADWYFNLQREYRNWGLWDKMFGEKSSWTVNDDRTKYVSLPAGTELGIDRVYIRKGSAEFSSVTFIIKNDSYKGARFWAKLKDVNNIEFEIVETTPNVSKPPAKKLLRWEGVNVRTGGNKTVLVFHGRDNCDWKPEPIFYLVPRIDGMGYTWELLDKDKKLIDSNRKDSFLRGKATRLLKKEKGL